MFVKMCGFSTDVDIVVVCVVGVDVIGFVFVCFFC